MTENEETFKTNQRSSKGLYILFSIVDEFIVRYLFFYPHKYFILLFMRALNHFWSKLIKVLEVDAQFDYF